MFKESIYLLTMQPLLALQLLYFLFIGEIYFKKLILENMQFSGEN